MPGPQLRGVPMRPYDRLRPAPFLVHGPPGILVRRANGIEALALCDDPHPAVDERIRLAGRWREFLEVLPIVRDEKVGLSSECRLQHDKVDEGDVVGLLAAFGGECAGALSLWPEGQLPPPSPRYAPCSAEEVRAALAMMREQEASVHSSPAQVMKRGASRSAAPRTSWPCFAARRAA
jgi:hypothetical protein